MFIVPLALVAGAALGILTGGSVTHAKAVRVAYWQVGIGAIALAGLVGSGLDLPRGAVWLAASLFAVGAMCMLNLHLTGAGVVLFGVALSLLPLVLNGHIAVDPDAIVAAGVVSAEDIALVDLGAGRELQGANTLVPVLGAVIPVDVVDEVMTFGDLVVMAGLLNLGFRIFRPPGYKVERRSLLEDPARHYIDLASAGTAPPTEIPQRPIATISGEADHPAGPQR